MTGKNIVGIVFSSEYDECMPELTGLRTMGSVPFAGRYRLIDFALSNMVNAGIERVGVITKSNYQSLLDHLGNGKAWDLSRKSKGLFILPPFSTVDQSGNVDKINSIYGSMGYISRCKEEYILLVDCNTVINVEVKKLMDFHTEKNADITILYGHGTAPSISDTMCLDVDSDGKITQVAVGPQGRDNKDYALGAILMKKSLLERLINEAHSMNYGSFENDIIQRNVSKLNMFGFKAEGYYRALDSMLSYFNASMDLLNPENCDDLFNPERPIYTKVKDDMPATYGITCNVKNSLVANGCIIDGEVENSIIFRGVRIEKGAVVKNSIVMQETYIAESATLNCVVTDKSVVITPHKNLSGTENFPIYVGKGIVI